MPLSTLTMTSVYRCGETMIVWEAAEGRPPVWPVMGTSSYSPGTRLTPEAPVPESPALCGTDLLSRCIPNEQCDRERLIGTGLILSQHRAHGTDQDLAGDAARRRRLARARPTAAPPPVSALPALALLVPALAPHGSCVVVRVAGVDSEDEQGTGESAQESAA